MVSCSEQDLSDYFADNILYNLNLSSENISVGPIDESHTVKITTNTEWSAQTSDDWIVLENTSGSTNSDLSFKIKANPLAQERKGAIGIYCFGRHKKDIIICQGKVSLGVSTESLSFTSRCAEQSISFQTEGSWTVVTNSDWIKLSQEEGYGDCSISIMVDELMSAKDRNGYVIIKDQSSQEKKISINQKGKYLSIDKNYLSFLASGDNIESINFDTDGTIEYTYNPWLICYVNNSNSISIRASENTSGLTKNGTLYISLRDVSDFEPITIHVHQASIKTSAQKVDLGLSVKWASFNIGSTNEDEIGGHYLYGEGPDTNFKWFDIPYENKNHNLPNCVTGTMYDTANAYWGGSWRMPTREEWNELINNTTMEVIALQNVQSIKLYNERSGDSEEITMTEALKFTAKNGNYIIVPKSGSWYYYDPIIYGEWPGSDIVSYPFSFHYRTANSGNNISRWPYDDYFGSIGGDNWFISVRAVWDD